MEYKVENHIPVPQNAGKAKYPFAQMKVGDSFLFSPEKDRVTQSRAFSSANSYRKASPGKMDWRFCTRLTEEGVRIWRIK